ncbi:MAG: hypothetical protein V7L27_19440 [Nostoc sp.]|uniref:hypothetical protein n=1 Tax=Nostoc sp. TaxID=1180 RepID=UPI002FF8985E
MSRINGTWTISVTYSRVFPPSTDTVPGYSDDAPFFGQTSNNTQWSLISAADGRVMYPNWVGVGITPTITSAVFTAVASSYDCVNGACVPKALYSTPGLYENLSACEVVCGTGGCSGTCVSNSDWAQIEGLSGQLRNRNCS